MPKIAVIADEETTLGFKALGVEAFPYEKKNELDSILLNIKNGDYSIVFISESAYLQIREDIKPLEEAQVPAIAIIPSTGEKLGIADSHIKDTVQRAVGMKL